MSDNLKISYSSLNLADSCMRKFEFNKLYPRRNRDGDQFAADVGKSLHAGLQEYMVSGSEDAAYWEVMKSFPYVWEFGQIRDDRNLEPALATLDEMMFKMDMSDWELMTIQRPLTVAEREILVGGCPTDQLNTMIPGLTENCKGVVVPAIEVPFEIQLKGLALPDGRGISFTGFMDAAMRHKGHGLVRTLDIKTHRRAREDATPVYKFDSQQVPYGIVLEHVQGNAVEEFEVLYLDSYIDLVNPRVQEYKFLKDSTDIQEWLINTVLRVQKIQRAIEMDYFPRTDGGCMSWNRPCYFLDVCQSRDRDSITEWLMMGEEAEIRPNDNPWIVAEIDVFGEVI